MFGTAFSTADRAAPRVFMDPVFFQNLLNLFCLCVRRMVFVTIVIGEVRQCSIKLLKDAGVYPMI